MTSSPFPPGSAVVGYFRDSGGSEQELSILQQEAAFRSWCNQHDLIAARVFVDAARPGSTTAGRDAFEEMIHYLRKGGNGEIGVVIWKYSRFSRDFNDAQFFKADLRRRGLEIISLEDNVPQGPEGRLLESIIDWSNERALRDMSSDIRRGKKFMVSHYKAFPGGHAPVGYQRVPDTAGLHRDGSPRQISRLQPDPAVAPQVVRAFEMRAAGANFAEILQAIPGIAGSAPSLGRVLRNRIYIGVLDYADIEIREFCPPLVTLETWQAAQQTNRERRERHGYNHPRRIRSRFILTGLMHCANCGRPMHGRVARNKHSQYDYYRCQSQNLYPSCGAPLIPKDELENLVLNIVKNEICRPELLAALYHQAQRTLAAGSRGEQVELDALRAERSRLDAVLARLVAAIAAHGHSRALLDELGKAERRNRELDERIAALQVQISHPQLPKMAPDDFGRLAGLALAALDTGSDEQKRDTLRAFVRRVDAQRIKKTITGRVMVYLFVPEAGKEFGF